MTSFRRFTGLQYYLAHARNTVHVVFDVPRDVTEDAFVSLVADVTKAAPQLLWQESLEDGGHLEGADREPTAEQMFLVYENATSASDDLTRRLSASLNDTGRPAFRAICQTFPTPDGLRSRIVFQTTHALMEGGDVADLLRGRSAVRDTQPSVHASIPWLAHIGVWLVIPLLWVLNLTLAAFERKDRSNFSTARIALNRAEFRKAAENIGISQRDLAFALTTHHRKPGARSLFAAYSNRPAARILLCDDEYLTVRMDEVRVPLAPDFEPFAAGLADTLRKRGPSPLFTQMWYRRITQVHRWLHPRAPWIYPKQLFGFAPYDVVLSLLPPVRIGRAFPLLDGARIFTGSDTGTAESCIFAISESDVTITLWSGETRENNVEAILDSASALGISAERST